MLGTLDSTPGESDWGKTGTSCMGPVITRNDLIQPRGLCFIMTQTHPVCGLGSGGLAGRESWASQ